MRCARLGCCTRQRLDSKIYSVDRTGQSRLGDDPAEFGPPELRPAELRLPVQSATSRRRRGRHLFKVRADTGVMRRPRESVDLPVCFVPLEANRGLLLFRTCPYTIPLDTIHPGQLSLVPWFSGRTMPPTSAVCRFPGRVHALMAVALTCGIPVGVSSAPAPSTLSPSWKRIRGEGRVSCLADRKVYY